MSGPCLNSWQPEGCEWTIPYLWRSTNWLVHVDAIVLALMLAYIVVVVLCVRHRYHRARSARGIDDSARRKLAADLSAQAANLRSIASTAPYCGLVGTCAGILSASGFGGSVAMEKNTFLAMMAARIATALLTTAAGILVAVPASCSYNFFRTRLDVLENELSTELQRSRCLITRRLSLKSRFSQMPAFAMVAAPGLAILVAVYTPFFAPREPTGLDVRLASDRCENDGHERIFVLHITNTGELLINTEPQRWNDLASRLSRTYSSPADHTLYLFADNEVSFQTVADAIDIVNNAVTSESTPLDIRLRLITPKAMKSCAFLPIAAVPFANPRGRR